MISAISLPILSFMLLRPLCPCSPPPFCSLAVPMGSSVSSCTTRISSLLSFRNDAASETAVPERFMNVMGFMIFHSGSDRYAEWNFICQLASG